MAAIPAVVPQRYEAYVKFDQLHPHPDNPNEGDIALLAELLEENGFAGAILAQEGTGVIIDGEQRMIAARGEGMDGGPVIWLDIDDDARDRFLASWNESGRRGLNNMAKLVALLQRQSETPRGLAGTSWTEDALAQMVTTLNGDGGSPNRRLYADPDEEPEPPPMPVTQRGDIWHLGPHRLICGDVFDPATMRALTEKKRAHMALTDPPYAIYGSSTGVGSDIADDAMTRPFFEAMWRLIAGHVVIFAHCYVHCDWRSWASVWESAKRSGVEPRNMIVWDKGSSGLGNNYANTHELIAFFARLPPQVTVTSHRATGQRHVLKPNIIRYPRPTGEERQHNAAKPVALLCELIENSTDPGQTVLDPFAGAGPVLIASDIAGRVCWAAEKEPTWCDVIAERYQRVTGHEAEREPAHD